MNFPDTSALLQIARLAGEAIMEIHREDFAVDYKEDESPLTEADRRSNEIIVEGLQVLAPEIPIISEESREVPYETRKEWRTCWLVDPLDGTKEFIKRNGEFTVNIALLEAGSPVFGIVYAPALKQLYYAWKDHGSFRVEEDGSTVRLPASRKGEGESITIIGSRSHGSPELMAYVEEQKKKYAEIHFVSAGSALKFCRIAEGDADLYPRLGPTMEWDTGAGHIIATESGKSVMRFDTGEPLTYNKPDLRNPWFICG